MSLPIQLLSTDFDGTLFAEFENPPVPLHLQEKIGELQAQGVKWAINTGRDLASLMEGMGRARFIVKPDYLILIEREIYCHEDQQYVELADWNRDCSHVHAELFVKVRQHIPEMIQWVSERFRATIYEDAYSPFCFIAERTADAEQIHVYLDGFCQRIPGLTVVRNDVYARFSHVDYNKGTALRELARRLQIKTDHILAAGDHLNDLPMLSRKYARWLIAPANAVDPVREQVIREGGYVSHLFQGNGVADGIDRVLREAGQLKSGKVKI